MSSFPGHKPRLWSSSQRQSRRRCCLRTLQCSLSPSLAHSHAASPPSSRQAQTHPRPPEHHPAPSAPAQPPQPPAACTAADAPLLQHRQPAAIANGHASSGLPRRALLYSAGASLALALQPPHADAAAAAAAGKSNKVCLIPAQPKVKLPVPTKALGPDLRVSRVIKGCWPAVSGTALPAVDIDGTMAAGVTTFDTGDVDDGRAELAMGRWLSSRPDADRAKVQVLTRLSFNDIFDMATVDRGVIAQELSFKVRDLGSPPDMVQLHWGTWKQPRWLDTVQWLADEQAAGRFKHLGLVNFDAEHVAAVLDRGIKVAAVQVPYSLVDRRPEGALLPFAREKGVPVLAALPLAGGLISGGYLGVKAQDAPNGFDSLRGKYGRLVISAGEWQWFQELLAALATIGSKHGVPASAVATRWVLDQPGVAAAVRPARNPAPGVLGQPFAFRPDMEDRILMNEVLEQSVRAAGSVYAYERGLGPFW